MCGIFGLVQPPGGVIDPCRMQRISTVLRHRGPDDEGWLSYAANTVEHGRGLVSVRAAEVVLLHRRLSILDLSEAGWQPMSTADGRFHIVFNGEIYNYLELRTQLERAGWAFHSHSDTEVLLYAYAAWGRQALTRLVGMFAFAVLDTHTRRLFLARDFFGIKPLYYSCSGSQFAFSSEIKALLELPEVGRTVNAGRLYEYLRHGATDHGSETLYAGIRQLLPGHCLELSLAEPLTAQPVCYWSIGLNGTAELSFDEAAARLRELFLESIRLHLRSDVPVGAALSGGVDSSAIVAAMRQVEPGLEIHTFSYAAEDPVLCEEQWVDVVGRASRAVVHKTRPTSQELIADLDHLIRVQDEPFGSTSIYAQYRVFQLAREAGIKVMLDGQGADELLAGYASFFVPRLASLLRRGRWLEAVTFLHALAALPRVPARAILTSACAAVLPVGIERRVRSALQRDASPAWLNLAWFDERGAVEIRTRPAGRDQLRQRLLEAVRSGLPALLRFEDRNSMAHSIESRVPFLTPQLAEFLFLLPEEHIIARDGTTKSVFRQAMRGIVPDAVLNRRDKIGFETPEKHWLVALRPWVERTLRSEAAASIPALYQPALQREWEAVLQGQRSFDFRIWRWINLIRWTDIHAMRFA